MLPPCPGDGRTGSADLAGSRRADDEEIARAFLVAPETMKRRLSRAKARIKATGIPFSLPPEHRLPERLAAVLADVYLIFNEGYSGRGDLAAEAIRLGRVLMELMPDKAELYGLVALMLCHNARRRARFSGEEPVQLADQDRSAGTRLSSRKPARHSIVLWPWAAAARTC